MKLKAGYGSTVVLLFCYVFFSRGPVRAAERATEMLDIRYAEVNGVELYLDLFLPAEVKAPPLVVYFHGGGWRNNDRKQCRVKWVVDEGFALASVDYRLSGQSLFPAQIHDCKAAVRWLRAHADMYGYNADKIAVMGNSAGGHLALLLGCSGGVEELEGVVGGNLDQSSEVQAIVDYFAPTDLLLLADAQPGKTRNPKGPVYQLLGGSVRKKRNLAELASVVTHVNSDDPPLLIIHGLLDTTVDFQQSVEIYKAYKRNQLEVDILIHKELGHGGARGGEAYFSPANRQPVIAFLNRCLKP